MPKLNQLKLYFVIDINYCYYYYIILNNFIIHFDYFIIISYISFTITQHDQAINIINTTNYFTTTGTID